MTSDWGDERTIAAEIREELERLRRDIGGGDESRVVIWAIDEELACCQRPLRDHPEFGGRGQRIPIKARPSMDKWLESLEKMGMRSVIWLSHPKELAYYDDVLEDVSGLLGAYLSLGWEVRPLPWMDPAHTSSPEERERVMAEVDRVKAEALEAFQELPKPVLMHCSAGIDRTPPVAAYIVARHSDRR